MPLPRLSQQGSGSGIAIGGMNRQITIQTRLNKNAYGQPGGEYQDLVTLWAKVEQLAGKEVVNNIQFAADVTTRFTTPYVSGIEPRMRILYIDSAGKVHYYDLLYISDIEEREFFLEMLAKEIFSAT